MPRLPMLSGRIVVDILTRAFGFYFVSQRGSHIKLRKSTNGKIITTIIPDHHELVRGTLEGVLELAQISKEEFLDAYTQK